MRPWSDRPITDCREPLLALPDDLLRLEPHPYVGSVPPTALRRIHSVYERELLTVFSRPRCFAAAGFSVTAGDF